MTFWRDVWDTLSGAEVRRRKQAFIDACRRTCEYEAGGPVPDSVVMARAGAIDAALSALGEDEVRRLLARGAFHA